MYTLGGASVVKEIRDDDALADDGVYDAVAAVGERLVSITRHRGDVEDGDARRYWTEGKGFDL